MSVFPFGLLSKFGNHGAIETIINFFWRLGEGKLMCSGFGEGHSAENVEKAMFSIEKHELEARGAALDATSTP